MLSVFLFLLSFRTAHRAHWNKSKVYFCKSELQRFNKRMKKRKHLAILFICFSCWWYFPITRYSCWFLLHSLRIHFSSSFVLDEPFYTANKVQICSEQEQRIISLTMNMVFFHFSKLKLAAMLASLAQQSVGCSIQWFFGSKSTNDIVAHPVYLLINCNKFTA